MLNYYYVAQYFVLCSSITVYHDEMIKKTLTVSKSASYSAASCAGFIVARYLCALVVKAVARVPG